MATFTLDTLQYSDDRKGPWRIYVYQPNSEYHSGGIGFRKGPAKYPDEELSFMAAKVKCANAMRNGRQVRIVDGGDMLVFHAKGAVVLYGETFWEDLQGGQ